MKVGVRPKACSSAKHIGTCIALSKWVIPFCLEGGVCPDQVPQISWISPRSMQILDSHLRQISITEETMGLHNGSWAPCSSTPDPPLFTFLSIHSSYHPKEPIVPTTHEARNTATEMVDLPSGLARGEFCPEVPLRPWIWGMEWVSVDNLLSCDSLSDLR